jgi:hypothetical protein
MHGSRNVTRNFVMSYLLSYIVVMQHTLKIVGYDNFNNTFQLVQYNCSGIFLIHAKYVLKIYAIKTVLIGN